MSNEAASRAGQRGRPHRLGTRPRPARRRRTARDVAEGRSPRGPLVQFTDDSCTTALVQHAMYTVVLVEPEHSPRRLTTSALREPRDAPA
ncbi:hypothetical protein ACIPSE_13425 [Streptomyces sp. NPDC090106]|uniref:hypothetical protein n=1 Tax=Streptomyces sp. NPDC090106 TaxID=3365946 RepID=UPI003800CC22